MKTDAVTFAEAISGARIIPLTQGRLCFVDEEDFERVSQFKWYCDTGYAARGAYDKQTGKQRKQRKQKLHRFIIGEIPEGHEVDHRDGEKLNNRRHNLRICTHAQNVRNKSLHKNNTSGHKGVSFFKPTGQWLVHIGVNGKSKHIGLFDKIEDAARAYAKAASEHYGDFAKLN